MERYGLKPICKHFGFDFEHHHALEDAKACGEIMLKAIKETNMNVDDWLIRVEKPINPIEKKEKPEVNVNGHYYGDNETITFTGTLSKKRDEYELIAGELGLTVNDKLKKSTTILVVGIQRSNIKVSNKQKQAQKAIENGQDIKIIAEEDFIEMIKLSKS